MDGLESAEAGVLVALGVSAADPPDESVRGVLGEDGEPGAIGVVGAPGGAAESGDTE